MSADLADYVHAREKALKLALAVLLAERALSDELSSVTALNAAEDAFVVACDEVSRTVRELPLARQPKGLRTDV